jgi:polar amino acid transport system substrate-binding protein
LDNRTPRFGSLLLLLVALLNAAAPLRATGQSEQKPLRWGADAEGGVPYIFANPKDLNGKKIGFEVDLAEALAKELGRRIEFQQYEFEKLVSGLQRNDFDFILNGLEITEDRKEQVLFTRPYFNYRLQLAVREDETHFDSLTSLQKLGGKVGTLDNTGASRYLQRRQIPFKAYTNQQDPYQDLIQKEVDGVLMDLPIALYVAKPNRYNATPPAVRFVGNILGSGQYAIAVRKGNDNLKRELDAALDRLEKQGRLKEIYKRWDLWQDEDIPSGTFHEFDEPTDSAPVTVEDFRLDQMIWLLGEGAMMTIKITVLSFLLAMFIGLVVSLVRLYAPPPFSWLAIAYVEFFRGIPVLLLLVFLYYGLSQMGEAAGWGNALHMNPLLAAILGFGMNYGAYEAEIYRAGIGSVPKGQWEAASSLGMSGTLTFRRIILPQAFRVILPPMTNDFVALFKDTSVVSVIAVVELTKQYLILTRSSASHLAEIALATAALYLIMSVPLGLLSRHLEKRWGGRGL